MNYQEWKNAHGFRIPQKALEDLDAIIQPVSKQHGGREFIAPSITEEGDTMEVVYCIKATGKRVKLMSSKVACLQLTSVALVEHGMGIREIAKGAA
jgi:hypothetical protein